MSTGTQRNALEILLGMEPPKARTARVKLLQLSETAGEDVYFDIRALGYDRVREIQRMESGAEGNFQAAVILAGVTQPNLKDTALLEKYGTPEGCEEQRRAFFDYVRGKAFHEDGTLRGYVWKDGSVHDEPEKKHK